MLWFILDENKTPSVIVDHGKVYGVVDVFKARYSANVVDCEGTDQREDELLTDSNKSD